MHFIVCFNSCDSGQNDGNNMLLFSSTFSDDFKTWYFIQILYSFCSLIILWCFFWRWKLQQRKKLSNFLKVFRICLNKFVCCKNSIIHKERHKYESRANIHTGFMWLCHCIFSPLYSILSQSFGFLSLIDSGNNKQHSQCAPSSPSLASEQTLLDNIVFITLGPQSVFT